MNCYAEKIEKIKSMHPSNFVFWVLGKFLFGLGLGMLLPVYFAGFGWDIAGWMLIAFSLVLQIPAMSICFQKRRKKLK